MPDITIPTDTNTSTVGDRPPNFNPDEYRDLLKDLDLSHEQENEALLALWNLMQSFVDIGFGLDPHGAVLERQGGELHVDVVALIQQLSCVDEVSDETLSTVKPLQKEERYDT